MNEAPGGSREGLVEKVRPSDLGPSPFVPHSLNVEILRARLRIVDPGPKARSAIDDVDGELAERILVGKIAPEIIVRVEPTDRLEGQRLNSPGFEGVMEIERAFRMDLHAAAEPSDMLVEGRLEPDVAKPASLNP